LRVAIKDNIDIAGVKTFASSRAYGELYGIASTSAPAIQKLLDVGAVIVGKTGMSQFTAKILLATSSTFMRLGILGEMGLARLGAAAVVLEPQLALTNGWISRLEPTVRSTPVFMLLVQDADNT
jgi:hypothetical protein